MLSKTYRKIVLLVAMVLVLPLLAACANQAPKEIDVSLKTFTITLSSATAKAGDVTFHLKNDATDIAHEFIVLKTDLAADKLPYKDGGKQADEGNLNGMGEMEDIEPGKGGDLTLNLTAGHYVLICNTEDHYKAGMWAEFTVVP